MAHTTSSADRMPATRRLLGSFTTKWCTRPVAMLAAASTSPAPGATSLGSWPRWEPRSQLPTAVETGTSPAKTWSKSLGVMTPWTGLWGLPWPPSSSSSPTATTQFCPAAAIAAKACVRGASHGHSGNASRGFMAASTVMSPTSSASKAAGGSKSSNPRTSGTVPSPSLPSALEQRPASHKTFTMSRADSTPCTLPQASTTRWCRELLLPVCKYICLAASFMVVLAPTVSAGSMH
mmetsp:Transcript_28059/g.75962  ORF Transcript_28059/g.75962 Transcript_28059/m.75962 type:complete len:235 (-) Transcript_28059:441-1145(-)